jgi:hypothetical protein
LLDALNFLTPEIVIGSATKSPDLKKSCAALIVAFRPKAERILGAPWEHRLRLCHWCFRQSRGTAMAESYPVREDLPAFDAQGSRQRAGGCSCGAVRYLIKGEPFTVGICHCTECRKANGTAFLFYADWPRAAITIRGNAREYRGRSFCPVCGSRLFHLSDNKVEIELGSLDDGPSDLLPTQEGWIQRREPWLVPVHGAGQFSEDPQ